MTLIDAKQTPIDTILFDKMLQAEFTVKGVKTEKLLTTNGVLIDVLLFIDEKKQEHSYKNVIRTSIKNG